MSKFTPNWALSFENRKEVSEMTGKIILWILEGQSIGYMSKQLNLHPQEVEWNIDEILYTLRKQVGWRRYLRILFQK